MYVYIYIYICMCVYTYIYIYIYIYTPTHSEALVAPEGSLLRKDGEACSINYY